MEAPLQGHDLQLTYEEHTVAENLNVTIPDKSFTVILGPNACGKSTLLKALSRLLTPKEGEILLEGHNIANLPTKDVARRLALLPQSSIAPTGIRVRELVARGRFPHQSLLNQWSEKDDAAIDEALTATGVAELHNRPMGALSGGQQQRVWISLVLAQQTPLLLLDEPTTYLDITHQLEILNLCRRLHRSGEYTLVAVLHDLNLAFRYATHLIVMKDGKIHATGKPEEIVNKQLIEEVYNIRCECLPDPITGRPMIVPADD